jgi:hypothetical protein
MVKKLIFNGHNKINIIKEMILNGKEFKIYDYDTQKTITERIASQLRTTPKYLWYKGVDK